MNDTADIEAVMLSTGFGSFVGEVRQTHHGRNHMWSGATSEGSNVFVKRLVGDSVDVQRRYNRCVAHAKFAAAGPAKSVSTPRLLAADERSRTLIFEYVQGSRSGAELMAKDAFPDSTAREIGRAIGELHGMTVHGAEDSAGPLLPSLELLEGLPAAMFEASSNAELEAWRLMQGDARLIEGIATLLDQEFKAPKVPAHCDFRLDQVLLTDERLWIADWEEFRVADPARDVGSFAGEWLYRSIMDIATTRGDSEIEEVELTAEMIIQRGVTKLSRLQPKIQQFWYGYRETRQNIDADLAHRATAFAGWHLLDRLIASASGQVRLLGPDRAAAGVGRTALLTPERFISVLGLGDGSNA
ncbi:class V lanthionine synthetase subunit LxmK [Streptomyces sp. NPDC085927]|uniref:class V lanthionine synthetase subunit LxmK n=1 Tax=Streptomyces sp. NPDC085927 TaxID=3365738 RepID=UPI0037D77473